MVEEISAIGPAKNTKVKKPKLKYLVNGNYPSRFQKVGELRCLFLSCFRKGRFPICSIGPSWPFTMGLLMFALFCLGYLLFMVSLIYETNFNLAVISVILIIVNLAFLFGGILADPGVHESIYLNYTKEKYGGKSEGASADIEMQDIK